MKLSQRIASAGRILLGAPAPLPTYVEIGSQAGAGMDRGPGVSISGGRLGDDDDYAPDWLPQNRYRLIEQMRQTDDDLRAVYAALTLPIERAAFSVEPPDQADQAIADFVWHELTSFTDMSWSSFVHHALLAPAFGSMAFEKIWSYGSDGRVHLQRLSPRMPSTFWQYDVSATGELTAVRQSTQSAKGAAFVVIPRDKLLLIVHDREGANYRGRSIFRAAFRSWHHQRALEEIAGTGAEKRAVGVDIAKLKEGVTYAPGRQAAIERAIRRLHAGEKQFLVETGDYDYRVEGITGGTFDPLPLIEFYRKKKITGFNAATILLGQSSGGGGSFALSRDQSTLMLLGIEAIADNMIDAINRDVVVPLCEYNFGARPADRPWPKLMYQRLDTRAALEVIGALSTAAGAGLITPDVATENEVRRLAEIDEIEARPVPAIVPVPVAAPVTAPPAEPIVRARRDDGHRNRERFSAAVRAGIVDDVGRPRPHIHARRERGVPWKASRDLRGPEVYCDFAKLAAGMDASENAILDAGKAALDDAARKLVSAMVPIAQSGDLGALSHVRAPDSGALADAIHAAQQDLVNAGVASVDDEMRAQSAGKTIQQVAEAEREQIASGGQATVAASRRVNLALTTTLSPAQRSRIDALLAVKGRSVADRLIETLRDNVLKELLRQEDRDAIDAQTLLDFAAGLSDAALRQDAAILTSQAIGTARAARQENFLHLAKSAYYTAALDDATCPICAKLDGYTIDDPKGAGEAEYNAIYPPRTDPSPAKADFARCLGWDKCRCDVILVLAEEASQV